MSVILCIFSIDGIKSAWEKKKGTSGDVNLILLNLLKESGIESFPLLVSERDHGKIDTTYPFYDQFNKIMAYVKGDGKTFILDATDKTIRIDMIPPEILNTHGFIVNHKKGELFFISTNQHKNRNAVDIVSSINEDGLMSGNATIYNFDYARLQKVQQYGNNSNKYEESILKPYNAIKVDSFTVEGIDSDSGALLHKIKFNHAINKTGIYYLLNYNLFSGFEKNPFVTDQRFTNINFGCPYSSIINQTIQLSSNLATEPLPKNIKLVTPDKSMVLNRIIEQSGNIIRIRLEIDINRTLIPAQEYPVVREFYKKMIDLLNEPVIIKAKL